VIDSAHMSANVVTIDSIQNAARSLGLSGRPICVHASLRSFGWVEGGPQTVIDGLLAEGCTVVVPTFSWDSFAVDPLLHQQPARNGSDYVAQPRERAGTHRIYTPDSTELDQADMGAIPAAVLAMPDHVRGNHPLCSFSAVGPLARELISAQAPLRVFGPLELLADRHGTIILMGVGLDSMTFLHLAEQHAGRNLFRRWANGSDGRPMEVEVGGCSQGFPQLESILKRYARQTTVGQSVWYTYEANESLHAAAEAIRNRPPITRCNKPRCRCDDAILGGPILAAAPS
jgi:aminoglycoside N3'-acetyltransferase